MKKWAKITLIGFSSLVLVALGSYSYLMWDTPYEKLSTKGLAFATSERIPLVSTPFVQDTTNQKNIVTDGIWFADHTGRKMVLRGLNLGGGTKLPKTPNLPSHVEEGFFNATDISFVGRPFPLEEADEHLRRIKHWGFNLIRFLVTWEAIEHKGPGIYDQEYLSYVRQVILKAGDYGLNVFIDPHQDVWSRFSGGSGAPKWTFDKVGLNVTKFKESGAAVVHNTHGDPYPRMIWPTNYGKLATATMFTLFFGGNDFAPNVTIDSIPVQEYLQSHFINAMKQVALQVKDLPNVVGFETMNEPSMGYIGQHLEDWSFVKNGDSPNFYEGMVAGAGHTMDVEYWAINTTGFEQGPNVKINPKGISVWNEGHEPIWKRHGVWGFDDQGSPMLLQPDYFKVSDPNGTYFKPFVDRYSDTIRAVDDRLLIFVEPPLTTEMPSWKGEKTGHFVNATHWYDVVALFTKKYVPFFTVDEEDLSLVIGRKNVRQYFEGRMAKIKSETEHTMGARPTIIGEFGIPMDLNNGEAYATSDFTEQEKVLDRSFNAIENELLHYALWTYVEDNTNERGDQWNGEDLSIFSESQQSDTSDINSGGRALNAMLRPYPHKTAGIPLFHQFNMEAGEYIYKYRADTSSKLPTELYLPDWHYGQGFTIHHSGGTLAYDKGNQLLLHYADTVGENIVIIKKL
ncbi:cellulase family glycosylhydrolase [Croceitalea sp. MTPC5]|uniref:glycoside hydrolase family 5 protein n=1 Tax=Croceitalea sp. MTPC5 TaxID=3056565 RepID=UPI002B3731CD|nr:cellulase family glycosylhydrolase [Croceitalea sp. MTPC5]